MIISCTKCIKAILFFFLVERHKGYTCLHKYTTKILYLCRKFKVYLMWSNFPLIFFLLSLILLQVPCFVLWMISIRRMSMNHYPGFEFVRHPHTYDNKYIIIFKHDDMNWGNHYETFTASFNFLSIHCWSWKKFFLKNCFI